MTTSVPPASPKVRPGLLIILLLTLALLAFYKFGRPIWKPLQVKLFGGATVQSMITRHKAAIRKRFPRWDQLTNGKLITLIALKQTHKLELWKWRDGKHTHVKTYPFTGYSGKLGPKLRKGDLQIPEGVYKISFLHPNSSYHLSMKVSYPNAFDRKMGKRDKRRHLGGDIFIHGKNVTIGCIPIGDRPIEELFTIIASNGYRNTRVLIAPFDLRAGKRTLDLPHISWEQELYARLKKALRPYQSTTKAPQARGHSQQK